MHVYRTYPKLRYGLRYAWTSVVPKSADSGSSIQNYNARRRCPVTRVRAYRSALIFYFFPNPVCFRFTAYYLGVYTYYARFPCYPSDRRPVTGNNIAPCPVQSRRYLKWFLWTKNALRLCKVFFCGFPFFDVRIDNSPSPTVYCCFPSPSSPRCPIDRVFRVWSIAHNYYNYTQDIVETRTGDDKILQS